MLAFTMSASFLIGGCRNDSRQAGSTSGDFISITDLCGRKIEIPKNISGVLITGPVDMILVYMLAPDRLLGLTMEPNGDNMPGKYRKLPVLGGWYMTESGNYESFLAAKPDIILAGGPEDIDRMQARFGSVPVVCLDRWNGFDDYRATIRFLGGIIGEKTKAEELVDWFDEAKGYVASRVKDIPAENRVRVFYAEGKEGLNTEPSGSARTELIKICGGINVAAVGHDNRRGMSEVSIEQVISWNPDVIIIGRASQENLRMEILGHPRWNDIAAVQDKRVYTRPDNPFSWFDGPPGPNQIIGIYWTAKILYPDLFRDLDLKEKVREFYSKFYHFELDDRRLNNLVGDL